MAVETCCAYIAIFRSLSNEETEELEEEVVVEVEVVAVVTEEEEVKREEEEEEREERILETIGSKTMKPEPSCLTNTHNTVMVGV
jgi:hypothetical protein